MSEQLNDSAERAVAAARGAVERVSDGLIRISPSQIKAFRETEAGGCNRAWAFDKIDRVPRRTSAAQQGGIDKHAETENWLKNRVMPGDVVKQLIRTDWLPIPSPDLLIEQGFERPLHEIANDTLLIGFMDFIDPRERVVGDLKFTSDLKWALDHNELLIDPQSIIYSKIVMEALSVESVTARWLYAAYSRDQSGLTGGTPKGGRRVQVSFTNETMPAKWADILQVSREIREHKLHTKRALDVKPNPRACRNYGGCQYLSICPITPAEKMIAHQIQFERSQGNAVGEPVEPPLVQLQPPAKNASTTESEPVISAAQIPGGPMVDFAKRVAPATPTPNGAAPSAPPPAAPPARTPPPAGTAAASFAERVKGIAGGAGVNPPEQTLAPDPAPAPPAPAPATTAAPSTPAEATVADTAPKRRQTKAAVATVPGAEGHSEGAVYTVVAMKCIANALEAAGKAIHETLASMGR